MKTSDFIKLNAKATASKPKTNSTCLLRVVQLTAANAIQFFIISRKGMAVSFLPASFSMLCFLFLAFLEVEEQQHSVGNQAYYYGINGYHVSRPCVPCNAPRCG